MSKALKAAIDTNDPAKVREALKKVKDINRKMPGSGSPLAYAAGIGADKVIDGLFDAGAVAEKRHMFEDDKPFAIAAIKNKLPVLKRFLELKKVPQETLQDVAEDACFEGRLEVLEFLMKEARPKIRLGMYRLAAAKKAAPAVLKILFANGADVNARFEGNDAKDITVLHELAPEGKAAIIRVLVDAGADVNARDEFGRTPLMTLAAGLNGIEFANHHARVTLKSLQSGESKLISGEAPAVVDPLEALETLIDLGADAKAVDNFGNDVLDHAWSQFWRDQRKVPESVIKILQKAGARGSQPTADLFEALRKGDPSRVRAAIEKGADVNRFIPPEFGSPLDMATENIELLRILLQAGANPNGAAGGKPHLVGAARRGKLDIIKELIAAGADVHATYKSDEYIENAYSASATEPEIRAYLKSLGASNPKYDKPLKPGVASWNDFSEFIMKGPVESVAEGLAKMIGGKVQSDAYGQTFSPGQKAYVVIRPKGMDWCNVFRVTPSRLRYEDSRNLRLEAVEMAKACAADLLLAQYSDCADAASIDRFDSSGRKTDEDKGWDHASLKEFVEELGDDAPPEMKKQLAESDEDDLTSSERLVALAEKEKFVVAAFWFNGQPDKPMELEIVGYGPEAFDGVAFVSN